MGLVSVESPDGAYLYHVESRSSNSPGPLWQIPLNGGAPVKLADGAISTAFDAVDGGVYYLERAQQETRLRYVDLATRKTTLVAANLGTVSFGLTASRDGRTILFGRVDSSVDDLMVVEHFR